MSKYKVCFYPSATQDPRTITCNDLGTAQRIVFAALADVNDDAEICVNDANGHRLGSYFYRVAKSGKWQLIRALETV